MASLKYALRALIAAIPMACAVVSAHTDCAKNCYTEIAGDNGCLGRSPYSARINLDCFCKLSMTVIIPQCEIACRSYGDWDAKDRDVCGPVGQVLDRKRALAPLKDTTADDISVTDHDGSEMPRSNMKFCHQPCYHTIQRAEECSSYVCSVLDLTTDRAALRAARQERRDAVDIAQYDRDARLRPTKTYQATVNATGTVLVQQARVSIWSNCGFFGITCAMTSTTTNEATDLGNVTTTDPVQEPTSVYSNPTVTTRNAESAPEPRFSVWSSCGEPGITCAVTSTTTEGVGPIDHTMQEHLQEPTLAVDNSLITLREAEAARTWKPWSNCGASPGITCAHMSDTSAVASVIETTVVARGAERWKPWSNCGAPGITCAKDFDPSDEADSREFPGKVGTSGTNSERDDATKLLVSPKSVPTPTLCGLWGITCAGAEKRDAIDGDPALSTLAKVVKRDTTTLLNLAEDRAVPTIMIDGFPVFSRKSIGSPTVNHIEPTNACTMPGITCAFQEVEGEEVDDAAPKLITTETASTAFTLPGPPPLNTPSPIATAS